MKRVPHPVWWLAGAAVVGLALNYVAGGLVGALGGLIFFGLGERHWLRTWTVSILAAARLLIEQDINPGAYVEPLLLGAELAVPTLADPGIAAQGIVLRLAWDNRTGWPVTIRGIRGTLRVGECEEKLNLPGDISDVPLGPLEKSDGNPERVFVPLGGAAWEIIRALHVAQKGSVMLRLNLQATINGKPASYRDVSFTAYYLATWTPRLLEPAVPIRADDRPSPRRGLLSRLFGRGSGR